MCHPVNAHYDEVFEILSKIDKENNNTDKKSDSKEKIIQSIIKIQRMFSQRIESFDNEMKTIWAIPNTKLIPYLFVVTLMFLFTFIAISCEIKYCYDDGNQDDGKFINLANYNMKARYIFVIIQIILSCFVLRNYLLLFISSLFNFWILSPFIIELFKIETINALKKEIKGSFALCLLPLLVLVLFSIWSTLIMQNLDIITIMITDMFLLFLTIYYFIKKETKTAIHHGVCLVLFIASFNNYTLNDKKIGLFETQDIEYFVFLVLIVVAGVINCMSECFIYQNIFENSGQKKLKVCIIQAIAFHIILAMSLVGKDYFNFIFEGIFIRGLIFIHYALLIISVLVIGLSKFIVPQLSKFPLKYRSVIKQIIDITEQNFWNESKTWMCIFFWRLIIISYGEINQWCLSMLVFVYFTVRPFKNCKMDLNMIKAVTTACAALSVFFNSHHHENYYQLKFRDMYIGLYDFVPAITPVFFIFNHFGHTFMLFILNQLTYVMAKPPSKEESDINLIPIQGQIVVQNRESNIMPYDLSKTKDIEEHFDQNNSKEQLNTEPYILMNFYTTYIIGCLTIAIWFKYLVDSYIKQLTLFDMDIMFLRTIWMIVFQFFNLHISTKYEYLNKIP